MVILLSMFLKAQPITSSSTSVPKDESLAKKVNVLLVTEYTQAVVKEEQSEREAEWTLAFIPSYRINDLYTFSVKTALTKQLYGAEDIMASDTELNLRIKGYRFDSNWITYHSLATIVPTSVRSQETDRLNSAIILNNGIAFSGDLFTAKYSLGVTKYFHEYSQNADGVFLPQYAIKNTLDLGVSLSDRLSLGLVGVYRIGFSYENDPRYIFEVYSDLSYKLSNQFIVNLGLSNSGNALAANGVDSNISIYAEESSFFRTGLTYIY